MAVVVVVAVVAGAVALIRGRNADGSTVVATTKSCAAGWRGGRPGEVPLTLRNASGAVEDFTLFDGHGLVYAQRRSIAPGTSVHLAPLLPAGSYTWQCSSPSGTGTLSGTKIVAGSPVAGANPVKLIAADDLINADYAYRAQVSAGLATLAAETDALLGAVTAGSRSSAEAAWLTAHLEFARLGAAYDTFGKRTDQIDGRPNGLPGGVDDPSFTGFGRLEYGLWNAQPMASLVSVASTLTVDVRALLGEFPHDLMPQGDPPLRAHEILENALQFELTGQTDEGSHTNLATARAEVDATRMVLGVLASLLADVAPARQKVVTGDLDRVTSLLEAQHHPDGSWTAVPALSVSDRERLDAAVSQALEDLAPVPDLLTPPDDNA
jgi:high-affinity iron transporter